MTGTAFKSMVATHLNRTDLTNVIATMASVAVKKLERECLWFQQASTTISVTAGDTAVVYPTDFLMEIQDGYKNTNGQPLTKKDWATIDHWQRYNSSTSSIPAYYAIADQFYIYPCGADTQSLQYYKSLGFPGDTASNAWTDTVYDLTFWATVEEVWNYMRNTEEQTKAQAQKLLVLKDVRSQSGRLTGTGQVEYQDY